MKMVARIFSSVGGQSGRGWDKHATGYGNDMPCKSRKTSKQRWVAESDFF
jgi:hypothetical protein